MPHAIASPAAILASGAMNRIINPSQIHTAPSHDVLSAILFLIQFFILVSF